MFKQLLKSLLIASIVTSSLAFADIIEGSGKVAYVIDGDTMWITTDKKSTWTAITKGASKKSVRFSDQSFKTRLLNINTEESVHQTKSRNTPFGKMSGQVAKNEMNGKTVTFKCDGVGKYGRPLCSIYAQGNDFAQGLIERGISPYVTKYGRHKWADKGYAASELYAKRNKLGMWGANKEASIKQWLPQ